MPAAQEKENGGARQGYWPRLALAPQPKAHSRQFCLEKKDLKMRKVEKILAETSTRSPPKPRLTAATKNISNVSAHQLSVCVCVQYAAKKYHRIFLKKYVEFDDEE